MALRRKVFGTYFIFALLVLGLGEAPLRAQVPTPANFLAQHYEVSATVDAIGQSISAIAKIDFKATEASSSVRVELHPNLVVKEVKGADGKPLSSCATIRIPFLSSCSCRPQWPRTATSPSPTLMRDYWPTKRTALCLASVRRSSIKTARICSCPHGGFR